MMYEMQKNELLSHPNSQVNTDSLSLHFIFIQFVLFHLIFNVHILEDEKKKTIFGYRWLMAILLFSCTFKITYILTLFIAFVAN